MKIIQLPKNILKLIKTEIINIISLNETKIRI